jgi:beta-lactam-binding protein with PASTA domain
MFALKHFRFSITLLACTLLIACSSGGGDDSPTPPTVSAPSLVGLTQAAAESSILAANLVVGTITMQSSSTVTAGSVINQTPAANATVAEGSTVNLVVSSGVATTAVPDVVGMTQTAAESGILAANLVVGTISMQSNNTVAAGVVISQDPAANSTVAEGSAVNLTVSSGTASIAVPNVVGLAQANAEADITAANLTVGNVGSQTDNTIPAGIVISQNPVSGTLVSSGSAVNLIVSLGPAAIVVPNVVGLTQATAETNIVATGLVVGTITAQNDNTVPSGDVISQNPAAGAMANAGSAVNLVVSLGPASAFSDEFNANSIGDWSLRHIIEGTPAQFTTLDIDQSTTGALTIIPTQTPGWFAADDGPLVFKLLSGNFAVHIQVTSDSIANPGQPPGSDFNSAGLMARNPSGASGPENYVMLNTGRQDGRIPGRIGSETKTTVNSSSTLFIDQGAHFGELILCRVGDNFHSFRFLDGDAGWTATDTFSRSDLPNTLQVGLVVNAFTTPVDLRATFDFIRLRPAPVSASDCTP